MIYLEGHFYLLWIHVVTLILGGVLLGGKKAGRNGSWYELVSAYAVGVIFLALAGWLCIVLGRSTLLAAVLTIILPLLLVRKWWRGGARTRLFRWMARGDISAFCLWTLFLHGTLLFAMQPVTFPKNIPDGIFVQKESMLNTRIQFIAGPLPCDNYIPFAVAEALQRGVSFQENKMILPGQLVTDRTFFMALFYLPFRMALEEKPALMPHLPQISYVGTLWPNTWIFDHDDVFVKFLAAGIFLNGLLLLGAMALVEFLYERSICWLCMLVLGVTPYIISQTMFTWPKAAVGFFVIMASIEAFSKKRYWAAGGYAAIAYHCHPCAMVFIAGIALGILIDTFSVNRMARTVGLPLLQYLGACFLVLLPWFVWKEWIVRLPSDLIQQNFNFDGPIEQILWARIFNLDKVFISYPFDNFTYLQQSAVMGYDFSLIYAVGIFLIIPALWETWVMCWKRPSVMLCSFVLPSLFLVAVFSNSAFSIVHGLQALIVVMVVMGVARLKQEMKMGLLVIVFAQVALHLAFDLWRGAILAGQGFPV